jgi:hypothetical protein
MGTRPIKTALPGAVSGRLTVLHEAERSASGERMVTCSCECGEQTTVRATSISSGRVKSCGCLVREEARARMTAMHAEKAKEKEPKPVTPTRDPGQMHASRDAQAVEVLIEDGIRVVVVDCPFRCGQTHRHCVPVDVLPDAEPIRWSKCKGTGKGGLYRLVGWEDIEPTLA